MSSKLSTPKASVIVGAILLALVGIGSTQAQEARDVKVAGATPLAPLPEQMLLLRDLASRLASEVEEFQEDVLTNLENAQMRDLYHQADAVLRDITRFQREIRPGAGPTGLARDFANIDKGILKLLSDVRSLGMDKGPLVQGAAKINYADQQLHYAIAQLDPAAPHKKLPVGRTRDVLSRQAEALAEESQALVRSAQYVLAHDERGDQTLAAMRAFSQQALQFHEDFEKGSGVPENFNRDFAALDESWHRVVTALNAMTPGENYYLRRKADRIERIQEQIHRALGLEAKRPVIDFESTRRP